MQEIESTQIWVNFVGFGAKLEPIKDVLDARTSLRKTMKALEKLRKSTSGEAWRKDLISPFNTLNQDLKPS